jgi:hypothetical protein
MRKQLTLSLCLVVTASTILTSCKKDISSLSTVPAAAASASIPTFPLTWEGTDVMPTPPGLETVYMPWASGSSRQFPAEMADDYKSSDGWILLYNTFNTTTMEPNWFFMLYNVYRGVVRLYYYIPASANITSSTNITHTLAVEKSHASTSPMMNFSGQQVVDVNTNSSFASTLEQWQVARSTWYAIQYELAYDQNVASQNFNTFDFNWTVGYSSISTLAVHGTGTGTITGSVTMPGVNLTISPSYNYSNSMGNISISGASDATKLTPSLGTTLVNSLKGAITSGLSGIVSNLLGGIFKHSTEPTENVHLNLNETFDLTGTLVTPGLLTAPVFAIPGTDQSATTGFVPANNPKLGVFYISSRPKVKYTETLNRNPPPDYDNGAYYINNFTVDPTSYSMIYNPEVLAVADIINVHTQVMLDADGYQGSSYWYNNIPAPTLGFPAWDANSQMDGIPFSTLVTGVGVRITLDVKPKNGAPIVTLSKTFLANVVKQ